MDKLKEIRKRKGLTVTNMAKMLNISGPFYSQIEHKKRRLSYTMAIRIANIFHLKPDEIFYDDFLKDVD